MKAKAYERLWAIPVMPQLAFECIIFRDLWDANKLERLRYTSKGIYKPVRGEQARKMHAHNSV